MNSRTLLFLGMTVLSALAHRTCWASFNVKAFTDQIGLKESSSLRVIVVGGGRGIGLGFTEYFLSAGAEVVIISSASSHAAAARLAKEYGTRVYSVSADLANLDSLEKTLTTDPIAKEALKTAQVSVFSAGIDAWDHDDPNLIRKMRTIKSEGSRTYHKHLLRYMNQKKRGAIILVSSISALEPFPVGKVEYSQSNIDLVNQAYDINRSSPGVKAFALTPGLVGTDMLSNLGIHPLVIERWGDSVPSVVHHAMDILANPNDPSNRRRFVRGDGVVVLPGNEFNMRTLESLKIARELYGQHAAEAILENSLAMQSETKNMSVAELNRLLNLTDQAMAYNDMGRVMARNPFARMWCRWAFEVSRPFNPYLRRYRPPRGQR